jgi:hypothetical protein
MEVEIGGLILCIGKMWNAYNISVRWSEGKKNHLRETSINERDKNHKKNEVSE